MVTWHVYQLRSDTKLLYVGNSRRLTERLAAHRREKPWWPEVTEVRSEEFLTEDEARRREKELWAEERPRYNQVSPFRTDDEDREYNRVRQLGRHRRENAEQTAKRHQRSREYMREYNRRPEVVARHARWYQERRRRQTGPGLF